MNPQSLSTFPPGIPFLLHALILGALVLHIGAGSVAILAGFAAILLRKGSILHRAAGTLFVVAMLIMAVMAVFLASRIPQRGNVGGGALVFYLVATAWMAARRKDRTIGRFEIAAFLGALAIAAMMLLFGLQAVASATGRLDGYPPAAYFFTAAFAFLFAGSDLDMILGGGVSGTRRIARHLGRMGLALFVASGSFFIGQQKVMPQSWHGSPILLVLGLAPLALTIFWLIRIRLGRGSEANAAFTPAAGPVPLQAGGG